MRRMYDCIHDNVGVVAGIFKPGDMIAGYVTGSPNIRWNNEDFKRFPLVSAVTIDQGFTGSPVTAANVRDVEPGAWNAQKAISAPWSATRPTIYCSRDTLTREVIPGGWRGDVWLADPEPMPTSAPHYPGVNVVAVQYGFHTSYDVSVVFDDNWPHLPPIEDVLSVTGHAGFANFGWTFHPNVIKSELVIKGAGGKGTGTDYKDLFIQGNSFHAHEILAPGWYIARVRGFSSENLTGVWSAWRKFQVTKP